ncbi:MAG: TlpA family protein disulfide reductase [Gaiellaceae bacterium]
MRRAVAIVGVPLLVGALTFAALAVFADDGRLGGEAGEAVGAPAEPVAVSPEDAPELSGEDPITGQAVALADFRGKPVVINIWASWCPGCNDEAADLREFAADHPEAVLLGVDFQDTFSGAREFYERWGWEHPSIFDSSGSQTAALGLFGLPTTLFLDARHRIAARVVGATDRAGFERGLELAASG